MTKSEIREAVYDLLEERDGSIKDQVEGVLNYLVEEMIIEDDDEIVEVENDDY